MSKKISGQPGTDPQPGGAAPAPAPTPASGERTGTLQRDGEGLFVQSGNLKIRVDPASAGALIRVRPQAATRRFQPPADFLAAMAVAKRHEAKLRAVTGVFSVRAGYRFVEGRITDQPCVVVAVDDLQRKESLPRELENVPLDVALADPLEQLQGKGAEGAEFGFVVSRLETLVDAIQSDTESEETVKLITYEPPAHADLDPVTAPMTITCCVSPDAGWAVLKPFLQQTTEKMRLGMYDFTAPHIYKAARAVLKDSDVSWQQVLGPGESLPNEDDVDSTKANDIAEEKVNGGLKRVGGARFQNSFARTGAGQTFASAYHIKVAVRDDSAFWLSSGNWQSSNQPDIDFFDPDADRADIPRYNREWHAVVDCPALAKKFQKYLEHDFVTARSGPESAVESGALRMPDLLVPVEEFFAEEAAAEELEVFQPFKKVYSASKPLTVQPILTPDNYIPIVLELLRQKPQRKLYFQNQSLNPIKSPTEEYAELLELLAKYSNDGNLDVRIIFRNIGSVRKKLESLKLAGFNMECIKIQAGCHTKGMVIDGETLLVGSHNWTNEGTQLNRDASLLMRDKSLARYYEKVFLHDWDKLAKPTIRTASMPLLAAGEESSELEESGRYVRVPWSYLEET